MSESSQTHHQGRSDPGPYFFLSYAHHPRLDRDDPGDPDEWTFRFYRDLSHEVLELTDLRGGQPGFLDRELLLGQRWSRRIAGALARCRVFVPLYSPRYFSSENCGREWQAFQRRLARHEAAHGSRPEAIVPALWVPLPPESLPPAARDLQFDHHRFGDTYARVGFSQLIRVSRFADEYRIALRTLAQRVVTVAVAGGPTAVEPEEFADLSSAFLPASASAPAPALEPTVSTGPARVTVTMLGATPHRSLRHAEPHPPSGRPIARARLLDTGPDGADSHDG